MSDKTTGMSLEQLILDLKKSVESLESRMESLESRMESLESRMESLESQMVALKRDLSDIKYNQSLAAAANRQFQNRSGLGTLEDRMFNGRDERHDGEIRPVFDQS